MLGLSEISELQGIVASGFDGVFSYSCCRGCNFAENHLGGVLSRAQDELHLAKLKLDHTIKQETQKLYQKLITTRQHEMLRKVIWN